MNNLQKRDELADDAVHKLRELGQKFNDRLTLDNLRLTERYLKGDLEIILLFSTGAGKDATKYCAVLQHGCLAGIEADGRRNLGRHPLPVPSAQIQDDRHCLQAESGNQNGFVLIINIKLVEQGEVAVPTLVRLDSFQEFFNLRADSLYLVGTRGFETGYILAHRKLGSLDNLAAAVFDEAACQVIQSGTQVMHGVADNQRQISGDRQTNLKMMNFVARLLIVLDTNTIRVTIAEDLDAAFQVTDVIFGPFDFKPNAPKPT